MTASFDLPKRKGAELAPIVGIKERTLQLQLRGDTPMAPETFEAIADHYQLDDHRFVAWFRQLCERRRERGGKRGGDA